MTNYHVNRSPGDGREDDPRQGPSGRGRRGLREQKPGPNRSGSVTTPVPRTFFPLRSQKEWEKKTVPRSDTEKTPRPWETPENPVGIGTTERGVVRSRTGRSAGDAPLLNERRDPFTYNFNGQAGNDDRSHTNPLLSIG